MSAEEFGRGIQQDPQAVLRHELIVLQVYSNEEYADGFYVLLSLNLWLETSAVMCLQVLSRYPELHARQSIVDPGLQTASLVHS